MIFAQILLPTVMFVFLAYARGKMESENYDIPAVIPDPDDRDTSVAI